MYVSFGVAPAMLIYYKFLIGYGRLGIIVSFLFFVSGCLRLARFNANIDEVDPAYFQGLPIPAGALALVGYTLLTLEFQFPFPQGLFLGTFCIIIFLSNDFKYPILFI